MINMSGAKGESTEILTQLKKENLNAPVEPKDESCIFEDKDINKMEANDKMLRLAGNFGKYQFVLIFLFSIINILSAWHYYSQTIISITPEHSCELEVGNATEENVQDYVPTFVNPDKLVSLDIINNVLQNKSCNEEGESVSRTLPDFGFSGMIAELNWICDNSWKPILGQSLFFFGSVLGTLIFGILADIFGRLPMLVASNMLAAIGNIATSFVYGDAVTAFATCRFISGMATDTNFVMMYIIVMEYLRPERRTLGLNLTIGLFYCLGTMTAPWLAVLCKDWRTFLRATSAPLICVIGYWFVVPESAQWLLSIGKIDKAVECFRRIAKFNNKTIDENQINKFRKIYIDSYCNGVVPGKVESINRSDTIKSRSVESNSNTIIDTNIIEENNVIPKNNISIIDEGKLISNANSNCAQNLEQNNEAGNNNLSKVDEDKCTSNIVDKTPQNLEENIEVPNNAQNLEQNNESANNSLSKADENKCSSDIVDNTPQKLEKNLEVPNNDLSKAGEDTSNDNAVNNNPPNIEKDIEVSSNNLPKVDEDEPNSIVHKDKIQDLEEQHEVPSSDLSKMNEGKTNANVDKNTTENVDEIKEVPNNRLPKIDEEKPTSNADDISTTPKDVTEQIPEAVNSFENKTDETNEGDDTENSVNDDNSIEISFEEIDLENFQNSYEVNLGFVHDSTDTCLNGTNCNNSSVVDLQASKSIINDNSREPKHSKNNMVTHKTETLHLLTNQKVKKANFFGLLRTPHLRKITVILLFKSMVLTLCYDAMSRNIENLGIHPFFIFTLSSSAILPACLILLLIQDRLGRKATASGALLLSGIFTAGCGALLASEAFKGSASVASAIMLSVFGRLWVTVAYNSGAQYAAELIPTEVRGQGVAVAHVAGYAATFFSAYILYTGHLFPACPSLILGILSILCGLSCLFLPETLGRHLPTTLEEGEQFGKDEHPLEFVLWSFKKKVSVTKK